MREVPWGNRPSSMALVGSASASTPEGHFTQLPPEEGIIDFALSHQGLQASHQAGAGCPWDHESWLIQHGMLSPSMGSRIMAQGAGLQGKPRLR